MNQNTLTLNGKTYTAEDATIVHTKDYHYPSCVGCALHNDYALCDAAKATVYCVDRARLDKRNVIWIEKK